MYIKIENNTITEIYQTEVENSYFIEDDVVVDIGWTVGLWDNGIPMGFGSPSTIQTEQELQQLKYQEKSEQVKEKREFLLQETDWIVIKALDTNTPISKEWQVYRQALRDITLHPNYPDLIETDWPIRPS